MQHESLGGMGRWFVRRCASISLAAGALLSAGNAGAALVPQMARCAPYFADVKGDPGPLGQTLLNDQAGTGVYNT